VVNITGSSLRRVTRNMPDNVFAGRDPIRFIVEHRYRWLVPTVTVASLATLFALLRPDTWEASQSLVVRNEAAGNLGEPGKFRHADEMKTTQETILELAKSPAVLRQALAEVGPPPDENVSAGWPTELDVALLAERVKLAPPKGAEFGKTEVLYLKVRDQSRPRALALVSAVSRHLQSRFQQLRETKAQGMIAELAKAVSMAEGNVSTATEKLAELEISVGSDLAELRILHESSSGDSDLRRKSLELETELRQAWLAERSEQSLLELLQSARADQGRLLAMPSRLLESQPSLKRLKEGLVDAQLKTAELSGGMSCEHPLVRAAVESEEEISRQLHQELEIACRGVEVNLQLASDRAKSLSEQLADTRARLAKLGSLRAVYSNLINEVQQRSVLLAAAQRELSEARSNRAGAHSSSLIYTIDEPDAGTKPVGPGRLTIASAGLLAGLVVGAAVIFVTVPVTGRAADVRISDRGVCDHRPEVVTPEYARPKMPGPVCTPPRAPAAGISVRKALAKAMSLA
jgi:succinoglycan biosynthesis transport protein ExoP